MLTQKYVQLLAGTCHVTAAVNNIVDAGIDAH